MEFIVLFIYRSLSGLQNGLGYAGKPRLRFVTGAVLALLAGGFSGYRNLIYTPPAKWAIISLALAVAAAIAAIMVELSFTYSQKAKIFDIHFWELVSTGAITIAMVLTGGNVYLIAASVYPGLILHKGFVNRGGGLPWFDERTDDPTGKTFNIPLLNIKAPRLSVKARIILAISSLVFAALVWIFSWHLQLIV